MVGVGGMVGSARPGGNCGSVVGDYPGMRCDDVRLALSACLDDEALPDGVRRTAVEAHLAGCAELPGLARGRRAGHPGGAGPAGRGAGPDRAILAAVAGRRVAARRGRRPARREPGRSGLRVGLRWALGLLAVAQLMLAVPDLLGAVGPRGARGPGGGGIRHRARGGSAGRRLLPRARPRASRRS